MREELAIHAVEIAKKEQIKRRRKKAVKTCCRV